MIKEKEIRYISYRGLHINLKFFISKLNSKVNLMHSVLVGNSLFTILWELPMREIYFG